MIHAYTSKLRLTRLRFSVLAVVAALVGVACDNSTEPLDTAASSDLPETTATTGAETTGAETMGVDSLTPAFSTISYSGRLFGPVNLWSSNTDVKWGPWPFTGSKNPSGAGGLVTQISAARRMKHRLILSMTDGSSADYMTNGKFDLSKWKKRMSAFNTATIRSAVASGVSDGTIVGNQLIDEPETARWGGNITKSTIDAMAVYARNIFPTLPMGINVGPPGYRWRSTERFHSLDFVRYQYSWYITEGNISSWRNAVLNRASVDNVTPAFSLNILDGGVPDKSGSWDCGGTGGKGTTYTRCRMTANQVRDYGKALVGSGCFTTMWRFDGTFMSKSANQDAFKAVASAANSQSRRSCKRT